MTLNSQYTYLFLDFETTGLDLTSDFPLQIALIQTDHHLKVLRHYSQYISLPESIKKIKSNVSYMTGIDIDLITTQGLSLDTVRTDIADFFGPDVILIGQNIGFDVGFLKKFFPGCHFAQQIDTYPLAASSIPYLKSYSLESIDHHLSDKFESYRSQKSYLNASLSDGKILSAHDALYDCINGLCFIGRWGEQIEKFGKEFPVVDIILSKVTGEGITNILNKKSSLGGHEESSQEKQSLLPILTSPLTTDKKSNHTTILNRSEQAQHSKRSTKGIGLEKLISELPHPCIIAVSHGSKIDIIKKACKGEDFDYLKEEQIIDQEKLSSWLTKDNYTEEEFLFVIFYLSHYRDGYRVLQPTLGVHKHILDYLQIKKIELKKDKKILCSHGGLYYTLQNNPDRKETYKDYPICILDADRRHTTYNDYAQRGMALGSLLSQWEKFEYASQQKLSSRHPEGSVADSKDLSTRSRGQKDKGHYDTIQTMITSLTFFIAHFSTESETLYIKQRQYKRESNYILSDTNYAASMDSRSGVRDLRTESLQDEIRDSSPSLYDLMNKIDVMFHNPLKIQRSINQNKDVRYTIAPAVRYIDFAEYLRMFGDHKVLFFSPARSEYKPFLKSDEHKKLISVVREDTKEGIEKIIDETQGSVFIISHNSEKSKKIFNDLHNSSYKNSHTLIGEYLTGGVAKNSLKQTKDKPSIIIGGYHMLLHFRGEGNKVDKIIIVYVPNNMNNFIEEDILHYAPIV